MQWRRLYQLPHSSSEAIHVHRGCKISARRVVNFKSASSWQFHSLSTEAPPRHRGTLERSKWFDWSERRRCAGNRRHNFGQEAIRWEDGLRDIPLEREAPLGRQRDKSHHNAVDWRQIAHSMRLSALQRLARRSHKEWSLPNHALEWRRKTSVECALTMSCSTAGTLV